MKSIFKIEIPFSASLELTRRCNLRCKHCYIKRKNGRELKGEEWKRVMDELREMGTMMLTITGGEPLMRDDFLDLLKYASSFAIRLFTNATLIDEEVAEELTRMRIIEVETSLHGGMEFHDDFTGKSGAWERTLKGIELLRRNGIKVNVKMNVVRGNVGEMELVKEIAERFGCYAGFDPVIVHREDGDSSPISLRVENLNEVVRKMKKLSKGKKGKRDFETHPPQYLCGAGVTLIAIDAEGNVMPCVGWRRICGNVREKSLREIFYGEEMEEVRGINRRFRDKCPQCKLKDFCEFCLGLSIQENNGSVEPVEFLCKLAYEKERIFMEVEDDSCNKA